MRKSLFKKSLKHKVKIETETKDMIFFQVNNYKVRLWYRNQVLNYNCTCKYGSLKTPKYNTPCSHILSCFLYLMKNES